MKELSKQIGQLFILGFPGETPSSSFLNFIAEEGIGGVILFEENCPTHARTRETIEQIRTSITGREPFIAVDQEGGRICRLRGAPAEYRAPLTYGREGTVDHFKEDYTRAAVYLESLGFNLNLAPVADVCTEENDWLKDRCFGDNPETVAEFVQASVAVAHEAGLLCCLKHFPGLGSSVIDPHEKTARADYDEILWEQRDRKPFTAGIAAGADLIMTTHLLARRLDKQIVTGSARIVSELLRQQIGFDGPVITDDLTMAGAASLGTAGERAVAAFKAGHDLLLFGRDFDAAVEAYETFVSAVQHGEIDEQRLSASLARISGLKFILERTIAQ
ncbi:MAG: hypothetical protein D6800_02235 [Candidatus Zixiibacteriota bacterium]|nr:MAG: hypothetical protein D6800_02235 [candidate division Zixibacteria bacterium]